MVHGCVPLYECYERGSVGYVRVMGDMRWECMSDVGLSDAGYIG